MEALSFTTKTTATWEPRDCNLLMELCMREPSSPQDIRGGWGRRSLSVRKTSAFYQVIVSILHWLQRYWVALYKPTQRKVTSPYLWITHLLLTALLDRDRKPKEMKIASVTLLLFLCSFFSSSQGKVLNFLHKFSTWCVIPDRIQRNQIVKS